MPDALATHRLVDLIATRLPRDRPGIVGLAGSVAVGKTTLAREMAGHLGAEVVGTDGFLYPNSVLDAGGILDRKGFPESYDAAAMAAFIADERAGLAPLHVPTYDHATYDRGAHRAVLPAPRVVILEGINALARPDLLDVGIYLDAEEPVIVEWFVARFMSLRDSARADPTSFYRRFLGLSDPEAETMAAFVWDSINGPNLRANIVPQRAEAHIVVTKTADHSINQITEAR